MKISDLVRSIRLLRYDLEETNREGISTWYPCLACFARFESTRLTENQSQVLSGTPTARDRVLVHSRETIVCMERGGVLISKPKPVLGSNYKTKNLSGLVLRYIEADFSK